jgi:hypothetical protein
MGLKLVDEPRIHHIVEYRAKAVIQGNIKVIGEVRGNNLLT